MQSSGAGSGGARRKKRRRSRSGKGGGAQNQGTGGGKARRGNKNNKKRARTSGRQPPPSNEQGGPESTALPSKLWRYKRNHGGRRGGGRNKPRSGRASTQGYSAFGRDLPPPPLGPDGRPFDIEEELGRQDDGAHAFEDDEEDDERRDENAGGASEGGAGGKREPGKREGRRPRLKSTPRDFRVVEVMQLGDLGGEGRYHVHRLTKKKLSTQQALGRIARAAGIPKSRISYAGLKDKQALAVQFIAIEGEAVSIREPELRLTCLGRRATPIRSKDLIANRFRITVRGLCEADLEGLSDRVEALERYGVPNYFDSQRFGSVRHGQGLMARELVGGDAEKALRLWMATPSRLDYGHDRHLKRLIRTRWGAWGALAKRLRQTVYGRVLGHLAHAPDDWLGAIGYMPRQVRAFHLFAYQSLLWNNSVVELLRSKLPKRERFTVPYVCGRLVFFRHLGTEGLADWARELEVPLLGPDTVFEDREVEAACRRALEREGIDLEALALPEATGGFFKSEPRRLVVRPERLRVSAPEPDELSKGRYKVDLRFDLPRGAYGTLIVKRLFRG